MLQTNKLVIYPTSRAIRENILQSLEVDSLLPKRITIGDFEKKLLLVPGRTFIDEDTRILLLKEASAFSTFKNLYIDREFFAFLKNAKFLFAFFEELAIELVDIEVLKSADIYASYVEHLEILQTLLTKYTTLLDEKNYCDKILLPKLYEINYSYLEGIDEIELFLEGYLSNFEFELFMQLAEKKKIIIDIHTNAFNQKMMKKFEERGFLLRYGYHYKLNLSTLGIEMEEKEPTNSVGYQTFSSNSRILQVAYIKKSIYDFLESGLQPDEIVIVLPSSSFVDMLSLFNEENNFNFAMGENYKKTAVYQELSALYDYVQERTLENRFRLKRFAYDNEKLEKRIENWDKQLDAASMLSEFEALVSGKEGDDVDIYLKELHLFSKLFSTFGAYAFHRAVHLFLNRLSACSIDDVSGGKITVMEVLETRGVAYKGVIVVDFNEGIVPTRSQKDLFLSTEIRGHAGLPTTYDRENLQKYYYKRLFEKAQYVHLSYVEDEQHQPTRFLDELSIKSDYHDKRVGEYHDILFKRDIQPKHYLQKDIEMEYDFTKIELSSTRLKTYLDCKRKYYLKYIRQIEEVEIPNDDSTERVVGIYIHDALNALYAEQNTTYDSSLLHQNLQRMLYIRSENDRVLRFYVDIWLEKLKPFCEEEVKRFRQGYKVAHREKSLRCEYHDMKLVGTIDRIDSYHDKLYVVDYKTGKIPVTSKKSLESESNFQLQFYALLAGTLGEVMDVHYYDLNQAVLVDEDLFDEKLVLLNQHLDVLKERHQNFSMCDDLKKCQYCPYIKICDRLG